MYKKNWYFNNEALVYLNKDLISLLEVLKKANQQIFFLFNVQMTESLIISSLALNIFMKDHYNNNIPLINNYKLYYDIKAGYYRGITEVYNHMVKTYNIMTLIVCILMLLYKRCLVYLVLKRIYL